MLGNKDWHKLLKASPNRLTHRLSILSLQGTGPGPKFGLTLEVSHPSFQILCFELI
jgi:hypothetical protein